MGYVVRMPKLGLEMERGTVLEWVVEEGESVEADGVVAEIESEKTTAEVDAREGGVLRRVFIDVGESVPPGTPIGIVAGAEESIEPLLAEAEDDLADAGVEVGGESAADAGPGASAESAPEESAGAATDSGSTGATSASGGGSVKASPRAKQRAEELGVDLATVEGSGVQGSVTEADVEAVADASAGSAVDARGRSGDVRATPRAKQRAEELGVELAAVSGSGPDGAVVESDVESHAKGGESTAETAESTGDTPSGGAPRTLAEERSFGGMRRTIAKRLSESYRTAVHVTEHREVDATELLAAVDAAADALDADVSMTDVLLVCLSAALDEHPAFNATFENETHRLWAEHNVCTAVDVEAGLVAPVLPAVDEKSLAEVASARRELTRRTLDGEYTTSDLQGGTFTVTNLGVLGVESFDPVINPPQVAILGVDALVDRVRLGEDDEVSGYRALPLDLSFDHRVVDGADAARFLGTLADHLEDPWPLLPDSVARGEAGGESEASASGGTAAAESGDGPAVRHAVASNPDGMRGTVRAGGVDHDFAEDATGPDPVELFLGSFAACLSLAIRYQADMRDAAVDDIDVAVDTPQKTGDVESIDVTVTIDAPGVDDGTLDRFVEYGERTCHVADLLRDDLDVELSWGRA